MIAVTDRLQSFECSGLLRRMPALFKIEDSVLRIKGLINSLISGLFIGALNL